MRKLPKIIYYIAHNCIYIGTILWLVVSLSSCAPKESLPEGDSNNGGLYLPEGFEALIVVDSIGKARHLAINDNGDIYVKLRIPDEEGRGIVGLRDINDDGKADIVEVFGSYPDTGNNGTAMRIYNGYLYFSTAGEVYRIKIDPHHLVPQGEAELIVKDGFKNPAYKYEHTAKPIAFDQKDHLYVPFGAPSDVCQELNRKPRASGMDPCPQLKWHAGIWRFDANKLNQTQREAYRYATGIRSVVAMDWNKEDNTLYAVQHGRDDLHRNWPQLYTPWEGAMLPSEEFFRVKEGADGGWPYHYYDQIQGKKLLNPEYGGDGKKQGDVQQVEQPIIGFPGHFAPNDLHFYRGDQFPDRYKNGAFIAFHGSTIRAPYPQGGYFVAFVPFENGEPSGSWEVFADGFAAVDPIVDTSDAVARPMGIAMGPDGSLYVTDSVQGKIWRIMFKGDKKNFRQAALAKMEERKRTGTNIKSPHVEEDNLEKGVIESGAQIYNLYCGPCHQRDGKGDGIRFPPLSESEWVVGNKKRLIELLLNGLEGPITVKGVIYNDIMPSHDFLSDEEASAVLTYIRKSFGNRAGSISAVDVREVRSATGKTGQ